MGMKSEFIAGTRVRYAYLWISLIVVSLTSIGILSSRAQSLLTAHFAGKSEIRAKRPVPGSGVYRPLARSIHFSRTPPAPAKLLESEESAVHASGFSWSGWSDSQWWVPGNPEMLSEYDPLGESGGVELSEQASRHNVDPMPRLQQRDMDPQAILSNFITMGVVDLLIELGEEEIENPSEPDASKVNPFDKALKEAMDEALNESGESAGRSESENSEENTESDTVKEENRKGDESSSGGGSPAQRNLLFIGSLWDQPLATAIGTAQADLLYQSIHRIVSIELEGAGRQSLDMDVILRDRNDRQSVGFGDLNRDGFLDMVVTNQTTNRADIFQFDGEGGYNQTGSIYAGLGPSAAVICDLNADDQSDIAVAFHKDKRIVADGKGLRKFVFLPTSPVAGEFSSMVPYDFNSDGLTDLLLSDFQSMTATVYLNQKQGLFAASDSLDIDSLPYLQSRVDLDADGFEELVFIQCLGQNISVVMVDGKDGSISNLGNMALDSSKYFVLGDFNLDGFVDIALAHRK
jgi:hypothetical protein